MTNTTHTTSLREKINEYAPLPLTSIFALLTVDGMFKIGMADQNIVQIAHAIGVVQILTGAVCGDITINESGHNLRKNFLQVGAFAGGLVLGIILNVPKLYDEANEKQLLQAAKLAQTPKLDPETMIRAGDAFCNTANPKGQPSFINLGPKEYMIDCSESKYVPE